MLTDTHCHLTSPELSGQADALLARSREAGVERILTVATTPADAAEALQLAARHAEVYLAAGIHPHEAGRCGPGDLEAIAALHRGEGVSAELRSRLVAVGETGLDFHYDFAPPQRQEEVFRFQLALAVEVGRPVVIHARRSEPRVCDILADYPELVGRAVFHCFSADEATAERILDMGCWLSFTGLVTFRNAQAVRNAARMTPADRVMLETDAPYLAPEPMRHVRPNEPALLVHTARRLAEIRSERFEELAARTTANARRFFKLPEGAS